MPTKEKVPVRMRWVACWYFAMMVQYKKAFGVSDRFGIPLAHVPQSTVLGHCLAAGLVSALQLDESQVTAPGVPDLPAATPHFVAQLVGSACLQLPNSGCEMIRKAKLKT